MPKASSSQATHLHHRQGSMASDLDAESFSQDDGSGAAPPSPRTTALQRKRKNADAQAAFRARRANYIANLEETVTSLENAVRRLQDALRDARDENVELKTENGRLTAVLDAAGLDSRRPAGAPATAATPADLSYLQPNRSQTSLHNLSPSPSGAEFTLASQLDPSSGYPFFNPSPNAAGASSISPADFLTKQNLSERDAQGQQAQSPNFNIIPRPTSAASGTSSHSSTHSFHGAFDGTADLEPTGGMVSTPGLQIGLDELNLYGAPSPWGGASTMMEQQPSNAADVSASRPGAGNAAGEQNQESELGRSDTVKASDPRHAHRRVHSHLDMASASAQAQAQAQQQQQQELYNQLLDDPTAAFNPYTAAAAAAAQRAHSRANSSASSLLSNEGDLGHHHQLNVPGASGVLGHSHSNPHLRHSHSGGELQQLDAEAYYSSEGDYNDMDYLDGMDTSGNGGASLLVPGGFNSAQGSPSPGLDRTGTSPYGNVFQGPAGDAMSMLASGNFAVDASEMDIVGAFAQHGVQFPPGFVLSQNAAGGAGFSLQQHPASLLPAHLAAQGNLALAQGAGGAGFPGGVVPGMSSLPNPSQAHPQHVPMSQTLAAIKAQAFGTSRKARTRAKRPGADSAARVAVEALQARGEGLGLDVDLTEEERNAEREAGAADLRSDGTVKRAGRASGVGVQVKEETG
ncbi:hypothetical protein DL93DRAFT_1964922 [Clavulina sp. PMI_390]|nr:hypothetical protein DL93DRAFT_1964922 [Clavulina sp. PMI_390]